MSYKLLTLQEAYRKMHYDSRELLHLACTPNEEPCTQAGKNGDDQIKECTAYINQLKRIYPNAPAGIEFVIIRQYHEFGPYCEAAVFYNFTPDPEEYESEQGLAAAVDQWTEHPASTYAYQLELGPEKWDSQAIEELRIVGHTAFQPAKIVQMKMKIA